MDDIGVVGQPEMSSEIVTEPDVVLESPIAGFWWRLLAIILDSILIWFFGLVLGLIYFDEFVAMGDWGRLLGFVIFLAYFGFLNSSWGGGQTLGKRICKIMVVGADGRNITIKRSMLRAAILGLPGILNNYSMAPSVWSSHYQIFGSLLISMVIFGGGFGVVYFYIFNRNTRQSLHDLICSTYVVKKGSTSPLVKEPHWKGHKIVYGCFLALLLVWFIGLSFQTWHIPFMDDGMNTLYQVGNIQGVYSASLNDGFMTGPYGSYTYVTITVQIRDKELMNEDYARKIAGCVLDKYPQANQRDVFNVNLAYSYNIGINSIFKSANYTWLNPARTGPNGSKP